MPRYRVEFDVENEEEFRDAIVDGRWMAELVEDTDNPITVEHLQVYYDPECERRDGKGFCIDNSNGSTGHRFEDHFSAAAFIGHELERLKKEAA